MTYVTEAFAAWAAEFAKQQIPADALHHAKRALVDWTAALYAGAKMPPGTLLETALADDLDRGPCELALGRKATVRTAALINGTAAHTAEVDDIFRDAIYHPGAPTIAAALAAAQDAKASGEDFLRGIIVGYEVSCRIGATMGRTHYQYWHNTGTIGTFGATAAAASIYGLDAKAFAHALATCTTFAAGLQQAYRMDSMSKPLHAGRAAEAGIAASQMARAGIRGALDIIEADAGFGKAMSNGPDWTKPIATLGREFLITQMTFKNHTCCGHTFAPIDGALEVQRQLGGIKAADIAKVRVATYRPALEVACYEDPKTEAEARFSLKYVVATALAHGSVRLAAFEPARLNDTPTRELMQRIETTLDPEVDAKFPKARAARVEIETRDGRKASHFQPTRRGDPDAPLSDRDLDEKYFELTEPVLGKAKAAAVLERLWAMERSNRTAL